MAHLNLETYRHMWKMMLDKPFNATELKSIKEQYDVAVRMDDMYRKVYEQERQSYLAEFAAMQDKIAADLRPLSKTDVAKKAGYSPDFDLKRLTKDDMISSYAWRTASNSVKSDHERVKERWAKMSDAEKLGDI